MQIKISNLGETIKEALKEAKLKGIEQGIKQGMEQGTKKTQIEIAKNLLISNLAIDIIANSTQLSLEEVKKLAEEIKNEHKNDD